MVSEPTSGRDVIDFFLTSNHTLVDDIKTSPGIADHDMVVANVNVKPTISKQVIRKVPLFRKANWTDFRTYIAKKKTEFLNNLRQDVLKNSGPLLKLLFKRVFPSSYH